MTGLVDSHCHLDLIAPEDIGGDVDFVLQNAALEGVSHMLCVSVDRDNFPNVLDLAQRYPQVSASAGIHPNSGPEHEIGIDELVAMASRPEVVAIGETGLDYYRCDGDLDWQRARFRTHIAAARQSARPLIIHTREARADTLRILREEGAERIGGVMHCFAEDLATAEAALDLGFYISFSGIVTFNSARELKEVAKRVPAERLLIETDSPWLAPVPHRGRTNQPAYVRHVAACIADLRGSSTDEVIAQTHANFFALFPLARELATESTDATETD